MTKRDEVLKGFTEEKELQCGNTLILTYNSKREFFIDCGKIGGCISSKFEAIGRLVSILLRSKVEKKLLIETLHKMECKQARPSCFQEIGRMIDC